MKIKKNYLKPDVKVHQVRPTAVICGSVAKSVENNGTEGLETEQNYEW